MTHTRRQLAAAGLGAALLAAGPALAPSAFAQNAAPAAHSGDEAAVAHAVETMRAAMLSADAHVLESLTSEHLSYGHSGGRIENRAQFVENVASKKAPFKSIALNNQTVSLVGDDAIVRHTFVAQQETGGRTVDIRIGVLQVWKKEAGHWRLLARQAFTLPQSG